MAIIKHSDFDYEELINSVRYVPRPVLELKAITRSDGSIVYKIDTRDMSAEDIKLVICTISQGIILNS